MYTSSLIDVPVRLGGFHRSPGARMVSSQVTRRRYPSAQVKYDELLHRRHGRNEATSGMFMRDESLGQFSLGSAWPGLQPSPTYAGHGDRRVCNFHFIRHHVSRRW